MADPDSTPPAEKAKPLVRPADATEAHQDSGLADLGAPELNGLYKLARTQPFMGNFYRCAHARFAARATPETRVKQMIDKHPWWYRFCWWADASLLALVILVGIGIAGIAIYKTIWL